MLRQETLETPHAEEPGRHTSQWHLGEKQQTANGTAMARRTHETILDSSCPSRLISVHPHLPVSSHLPQVPEQSRGSSSSAERRLTN